MACQPRLVVSDVVHHAVARGVNGTAIFNSGFDKGRYLKRVALIAEEERVQIHGYCLLNNHVHFLLTPSTASGLARFFSRLHTWWAAYFNRKYNRTGHLFQSRYFSSTLSECHYWTALRYVELNPVRARLAPRAEDWIWSSARDHLRLRSHSLVPLTRVLTRANSEPHHWREVLSMGDIDGDNRLRKAYRTSKPCGPVPFLKELESRFGRRLVGRNSAVILNQQAG